MKLKILFSDVTLKREKTFQQSLNKIQSYTQIAFTAYQYDIIASSLSFVSASICAVVQYTASFISILSHTDIKVEVN